MTKNGWKYDDKKGWTSPSFGIGTGRIINGIIIPDDELHTRSKEKDKRPHSSKRTKKDD